MSDNKKRFVFAERKKALQIAATCGLSVIEEQQVLTGYQIYIVEQWVCDRKVASNVVKVFTGDESHAIQVCVIAISTAELQHPRPQIQAFLNLTSHLKLKPTPLGDILLTDPSELPFDMDMVLIPDGDYDQWINQAYVNINLKRANCTGRSSLNLRPPNPASEEKFRSLYKIADTVKFDDAVINLVSLVQISLYLFKLLDKDYIDGLICDETTIALWNFYIKYDPIKTTEFTLKESWMEPHLLAAIISKLLMCRNKLQDLNFTTLKDPFIDYEAFRFDIGDYQKYKGLRMNKFLDLDTLGRLKEYSFNQLKMRKVIKSKLDDISGTTNSPLFNETSDPEVFRHHATIESLRLIWRPRLRGMTLGNNNDQNVIHLIKGVSRSSGAALSRVAGLTWKKQHSPNTSTIESMEDITRKPSPLSIYTSSSSLSNIESDSSADHIISPDHLDQDIPSYVQSSTTPRKPTLRISKSSDTNNRQFINSTNQKGDFIPFIKKKSKIQHARSRSDSILYDPLFKENMKLLQVPLPLKKRSLSMKPTVIETKRPTTTMDVQTYMTYEKLVQQQRLLQQTYEKMKNMADMYEKTSLTLKETFDKRSQEFDNIQKESRLVLDEQNVTERRIKDVEDNSAKLHYELKVLNDKLKDIEDNVGTFYGKVGLLERRMDDSQQSITTMLIIGNYFNHYWLKVTEWIYGSSK